MLVSDMHNVTSLPVCAIFPTDYCVGKNDFFLSLKSRPLIILSQKEVRNVYKTLLEDDEHFEGWSLGHGYVHVISY